MYMLLAVYHRLNKTPFLCWFTIQRVARIHVAMDEVHAARHKMKRHNKNEPCASAQALWWHIPHT